MYKFSQIHLTDQQKQEVQECISRHAMLNLATTY